MKLLKEEVWRNQNRDLHEWREITTEVEKLSDQVYRLSAENLRYPRETQKKDKMLQNIAVKSCAKLIKCDW